MKLVTHYKGGRYLVLAIARMSEARDVEVVVYASTETGQVWVRPLRSTPGVDAWLDVLTWPDGVRRTRFAEVASG